MQKTEFLAKSEKGGSARIQWLHKALRTLSPQGVGTSQNEQDVGMNLRYIINKIKGITRSWLDLSKSLACTNSCVWKAVIAHGKMENCLTNMLFLA